LKIKPFKRGPVKRLFILPMCLLMTTIVCSVAAFAQGESSSKPKKEISFSKEVAPILDKFCTTCHNEDEDHPSQLFMDSYESLMKGGKHGVAVKAGDAKESLLLQKMDAEPPFGKKMPPSKKLIPKPEQIEILRQWIDQGAKKN
jgi:hypothetical protein